MRDFYIRDSDWCVRVYCLDESFDSRPILGDLRAIKPKDKDLLIVKDMLQNEGLNWGVYVFVVQRQKDTDGYRTSGESEGILRHYQSRVLPSGKAYRSMRWPRPLFGRGGIHLWRNSRGDIRRLQGYYLYPL